MLIEMAPTSCATSAGRSAFIPEVVKWSKSSLGRFDDLALKGLVTKEAWTVQLRLTFTLLAHVLDSCSKALCDRTIIQTRQLLDSEHDNLEYLLNLLPRLLESYHLMHTQQTRLSSTIQSSFCILPSSYPFPQQDGPMSSGGLQDAGAVIISLLLISPRDVILNSLEGKNEIEGTARFNKLVLEMILTFSSMLDQATANWINLEMVKHRVMVKVIDILQSDGFKFDALLRHALLDLVMRLILSPRLNLEQFSPHKS